jgi:hypothetical protein
MGGVLVRGGAARPSGRGAVSRGPGGGHHQVAIQRQRRCGASGGQRPARRVAGGGGVFDGEFDPGSGSTLAACLTHASRAGHAFGRGQRRTGEERVCNRPLGGGQLRETGANTAYAPPLVGGWRKALRGAQGRACVRLASWGGDGLPRRRSVAGLRGRPATGGLRHGPHTYGWQQRGIFRNGRKPDGATPRAGRRPSGCKPLFPRTRMTVRGESASANYVPAAAVRRRRRALSGVTGRKGRAGGGARRG